jgi:hypothetical protein
MKRGLAAHAAPLHLVLGCVGVSLITRLSSIPPASYGDVVNVLRG